MRYKAYVSNVLNFVWDPTNKNQSIVQSGFKIMQGDLLAKTLLYLL